MIVEIVKFKHFAEGLSTVLLFKLLSIIYNRFDDLVDKAQVAVCSVLVQTCQLRCCRASPVSGECGQSSGFPCKRGWPSARLRLSCTSRSIRSASAYFLLVRE